MFGLQIHNLGQTNLSQQTLQPSMTPTRGTGAGLHFHPGPARPHRRRVTPQLLGRAPSPQGKLVEGPLAQHTSRQGLATLRVASASPPPLSLCTAACPSALPGSPQERRRPRYSPTLTSSQRGRPPYRGGGVVRGRKSLARPRTRLGGATPSSGRRGRASGT